MFIYIHIFKYMYVFLKNIYRVYGKQVKIQLKNVFKNEIVNETNYSTGLSFQID